VRREKGEMLDPCPLPKTCWGKLLHAGIREKGKKKVFLIVVIPGMPMV